MSAGHGHSDGTDEAPEVRLGRQGVVLLLAVLAPVVLATAMGVFLLWPHDTAASDRTRAAASASAGAGGSDVVSATVSSSSATTCRGTSEDRLPDGSIPSTTMCASIAAQLAGGPEKGRSVTVSVPAPVYRAGISPGDHIDLERYADGGEGGAPLYAWVDFSRGRPLLLLGALFVVLVTAVARLRGLAAMAGLVLAYAVIIKFMLPALNQGENAVAVTLVTSITVMTVVLYLAHGFSSKTTTALLGTVFGLGLSAGLAGWATAAAHLGALSSEDNITLTQLTGRSDLSGVVLGGIILAGLGVLNDVTITQASAVWEVHTHAPHLGVGGLIRSGMRVGRDHLASTVYTIAFAYAGAALPTLILIDLYARPLDQVLTSGQIAEEIVRTLIGAIGLILAIPVTTAIAALVVTSGDVRTGPRAAPDRDRAATEASRTQDPSRLAPMTRREMRGRRNTEA